jgi:hypothetical protein
MNHEMSPFDARRFFALTLYADENDEVGTNGKVATTSANQECESSGIAKRLK